MPLSRDCAGCGAAFTTDDLRQRRCKSGCGRNRTATRNTARTARRDAHQLRFIGVDGEGVTRPTGEHIYDMLSVGSRTLVSPGGGQLHWKQIFEFLWECFLDDQGAVYAGFFLGYDFTQWLRTLPADRGSMLLTAGGRALRARRAPGTEHLPPFPVRADGWEFDLLGFKRFKLRPEPTAGTKGAPWLYINDAGPFFQQAFLPVIDPGGWDEPVCTAEEFETIKEGKANRGVAMDLGAQLGARAETGRYNTLENDVLGRVLGRLNTGLTAAGVRLDRRQWYGPGQAAQAWMSRIEAPTAAQVQDAVPLAALEAARDSYYGGWFEILRHGHVPGPAYEYDINSAYPHAIAQLPCLLHGRWDAGPVVQPGPVCLVDASVIGTDPRCGAAAHREKDGRVLRPSATRGWYWLRELLAAQRAGLLDSFHVHGGVWYEPCDCEPPFRAEMLHLYQQRLRAGKNSPEGKAYKLVYNSAYGKLAQSIGAPKFANPVYASMITSMTRTMILDAIATHPGGTGELLMVATDGVYFRTPHPALELDPQRLGAWDQTVKSNLTLFMPGVYWDDAVRQRLAAGQSPKLKSRGVSARDLAQVVDQADQLFANWRPRKPWPAVTVPLSFAMISATQAAVRGKWETAGTVDRSAVKVMSSDPSSKRATAVMDHVDGTWASYAWKTGAQETSTPYRESFGLPKELVDTMLTPDDDNIIMAIREGLL